MATTQVSGWEGRPQACDGRTRQFRAIAATEWRNQLVAAHPPARPFAGEVIPAIPTIREHLGDFANRDGQARGAAQDLRAGSNVQLNDMSCFLQELRVPGGRKLAAKHRQKATYTPPQASYII
jgi:hypothetical protein